MVDTARALLDELMGRNRNLDPTTAKSKKVQWDDPEVSETIVIFDRNYDFLYNQINANSKHFFYFSISSVCIIW